MKNKKIFLVLSILLILSFLLLQCDEKTEIHYYNNEGALIQYYGESEAKIFTKELMLEQGNYYLNVNYQTAVDGCCISISQYGKEIYRYALSPDEGSIEVDFRLEESAPSTLIEICFNSTGYIEIKDIYLKSDTPFHYNMRLAVLVLWTAALCLYIFQKKWDSGEHAEMLGVAIVVGLSLVLSFVNFSSNAIYKADDLGYHLTRIEGIARGLKSGQFPIYVYPDMLDGNGYLNVLYPSLFLYIPALLRLMGVSLIVSYKAFLVIINIATALSMYYAMKALSDKRIAHILASALYLFLRYRLTNIYSRGALGETLALIFLPLVIAGIYHLLWGNKEKWWILLLGMTGVINSHVLSAVLYTLIAVVATLIAIKKVVTEKRYKEICITCLGVCIINAGFIVPFLLYYYKNNLQLEVLQQTYADFAVNFTHLFGILNQYTGERIRDYSLRFPVIMLIGAAIFYCLTRKKKDKGLQCLWYIGLFLLFLSSNFFPYKWASQFKILDTLFSYFQFPFRLIGVAAAILIMVGSIWIIELEFLQNYKKPIAISLIFFTIMDTTVWNLQLPEMMYKYRDVKTSNADIILTNSGNGFRFWGGEDIDYEFYPQEYLPVGGNQVLTDYVLSSQQGITIENYEKKDLAVQLEYCAKEQGTESWIDIPLLHYRGYEAVDENNEKLEIITGEHGNIRVMLQQDGESHQVKIRFVKPFICLVAEFVSGVSIIGLFYVWKTPKKVKKSRKTLEK